MIRHFWEEQRKILSNAFLIAGTAFFPFAGAALAQSTNAATPLLTKTAPWLAGILCLLTALGIYGILWEKFQWSREKHVHEHRRYPHMLLMVGTFVVVGLVVSVTLFVTHTTATTSGVR